MRTCVFTVPAGRPTLVRAQCTRPRISYTSSYTYKVILDDLYVEYIVDSDNTQKYITLGIDLSKHQLACTAAGPVSYSHETCTCYLSKYQQSHTCDWQSNHHIKQNNFFIAGIIFLFAGTLFQKKIVQEKIFHFFMFTDILNQSGFLINFEKVTRNKLTVHLFVCDTRVS